MPTNTPPQECMKVRWKWGVLDILAIPALVLVLAVMAAQFWTEDRRVRNADLKRARRDPKFRKELEEDVASPSHPAILKDYKRSILADL